MPIVRVNKMATSVGAAFVRWTTRLPRAYRELVALQRLLDERHSESDDSQGADDDDEDAPLEAAFVRELVALLSQTSHRQLDFIHVHPLKIDDDATVIVVGALGSCDFVEVWQAAGWCRLQVFGPQNLSWTSLDGLAPTTTTPLFRELLDVGRFYAALAASSLRPGLYVADMRLVSGLNQM